MTRPVEIVACTRTGKKKKKKKIKPEKIKMVHDCLVGGGKHLSASPRFLSAYMIHTCRYMHPRCIHLNVYSHAPTQQTSVNPSSRAVSLSSPLNSHVLRSLKTFWPVSQRPTRTLCVTRRYRHRVGKTFTLIFNVSFCFSRSFCSITPTVDNDFPAEHRLPRRAHRLPTRQQTPP